MVSIADAERVRWMQLQPGSSVTPRIKDPCPAVTIANHHHQPGEAGQTASELVEAPRAVRGEAGGLQLPGPGSLLLGLAEEEAVYPGRGVAAHLHT